MIAVRLRRVARGKSLVVQMKMPIHVLVHGLQFVGHSFVQQFDALLAIHYLLLI